MGQCQLVPSPDYVPNHYGAKEIMSRDSPYHQSWNFPFHFLEIWKLQFWDHFLPWPWSTKHQFKDKDKCRSVKSYARTSLALWSIFIMHNYLRRYGICIWPTFFPSLSFWLFADFGPAYIYKTTTPISLVFFTVVLGVLFIIRSSLFSEKNH